MPIGTNTPPLAKSLHKFFLIIFFFFSFQMYIITNKSQKMFFYKYFYTRALTTKAHYLPHLLKVLQSVWRLQTPINRNNQITK